MGILDVSDPISREELDATYAQKPDNEARAVGQGELALNVRDYGAVGDGTTDDTAAIQTALNTASANGCRVLVPGPNRTYLVSQLVMGYRGTLEIPAGVTIRRSPGDEQNGPLVVIERNHGKIVGGGVIECLNACPSGVVRLQRTDGTCEWGRLDNVHVKGPGKAVMGSTGIVLSGFATFQNRVNGVTVSDVADGVRLEGGANANHCTDLTLYAIGSRAYVLDGTIESTIMGGSVLASPGVTVFTLLNGAQYNSVVGVAAEPGGAATFWSIASGSVENSFIGVVDNTANLGTDAGTRTTAALRRRMYAGDKFYIGGTRVFPPQQASKTVPEVVRGSSTYRVDSALTLPVVAAATYEMEAFIIYDATATADAKFRLSTPRGTVAHWTVSAAARALPRAAVAGPETFRYLDASMGQTVGGAGRGMRLVAQIKGMVTTSTTPGNLGIQWAQAVAEASDLTISAGSWLVLRRLA